jgi:hypothetical protein
MNKNTKIAIMLVAQILIVALLVVVAQKLTTSQKEKVEPAQYTYDGISFKYPGNWELKLNETATSGEVALIPLAGTPEAKAFGTIYLIFLPDVALDNWEQTITEQQTCSGHTNTLWYNLMSTEEFSGFECVWKQPEDKFPYWEFFLYNSKDQIGISILASPLNNTGAEAISTMEKAEATFPDIVEIAKSVRMADK